MSDPTTAAGSARARELAERFEQVNQELIHFIEPLDENRWLAVCPSEQATVAAVVSHVAGAYRAISSWAGSIAAGEPPAALTREAIDEGNARHAERHARRPKAEALEALRRNGEAAAALVRGLSDDGLDRSGYLRQFDRTMTAEQILDELLIGHPQSHLESIRSTLASIG